MGFLRFAAWGIAVVYSTIPCLWLVVHPRANRFGANKTPLPAVGLVWLLLWVAVGTLTWPWRHVLLYSTPWAWIPAAVFFACGLGLYFLATRRFTVDQVLGRSELHPHNHEQRLVTSGIRMHMRHPIYVGHFMELVAWSIGTGMAVLYAMTAFAVVTGLIMVRIEDRELEQRFGEEYRRYRETVPALVPRWNRRAN